MSIVQGPLSVAPCQTLANTTIRCFFIAVPAAALHHVRRRVQRGAVHPPAGVRVLLARRVHLPAHPDSDDSDEQGANRDVRGFGWEVAHEAVTRRPPVSFYTMIPGATRTTLGFGICPSFKGRFLSRRAKP